MCRKTPSVGLWATKTLNNQRQMRTANATHLLCYSLGAQTITTKGAPPLAAPGAGALSGPAYEFLAGGCKGLGTGLV